MSSGKFLEMFLFNANIIMGSEDLPQDHFFASSRCRDQERFRTGCSLCSLLMKSRSSGDLSFFSNFGSCLSVAVPFQEVELEH